jgi:hypothetical protein
VRAFRSSKGQAATAACLFLFLAGGCRHAAPPATSAVSPTPPAGPLVVREIGGGLPRSGQWRNGFDLADIDGDGILDLVHGPVRKGGRLPAVFLGDGSGGFLRMKGLTLPPLPYDYGDAAAADFDGDGRADIALAIHLRGIVALRNAGDGTFTDISRGLPLGDAGKGFSSRAIETVDWDGDGRPDLVTSSEGPVRFGTSAATPPGGLRVFLNRGGRWEAVAPPAVDMGFGDSLAVADVDGDGRPDAVTPAGGADGKSILHLNDGSGWRDVALAELRGSGSVGAVATGDVDGDGRNDIVVGYLDVEGGAWNAGIDVFLAGDAGWLRRELLREEGKSQVRAVALGDLDGDRRAEVVALRGNGAMHVVSWEGTRPPLLVPAPEWRRGCSGYGLRLADLDRDGHPEIVASFAGEASAFDLEGGCASGGGIQAWAIAVGSK